LSIYIWQSTMVECYAKELERMLSAQTLFVFLIFIYIFFWKINDVLYFFSLSFFPTQSFPLILSLLKSHIQIAYFFFNFFGLFTTIWEEKGRNGNIPLISLLCESQTATFMLHPLTPFTNVVIMQKETISTHIYQMVV
jgi:hypothetical protein